MGQTRSTHGSVINAYILIGKHKGKIKFRRPTSRWGNMQIHIAKKSDARARTGPKWFRGEDSCRLL
jgi:hypothetical protein